MTEYEKKSLELLAKIEERLKRIEERQNKWDQIGMPDIRACGNETGLRAALADQNRKVRSTMEAIRTSSPEDLAKYVSEETLTGHPIRYRIPCDQSQERESTAVGC